MQRVIPSRVWLHVGWSAAALCIVFAWLWAGASTVHSQTGLPSGAIGDWKFNESSGSTAQDDSGNANHGTVNNPARITGRIGGALQFDGVDDHVVVASPTALNPTRYAISAWVRFTTTDTSGGEIASMGDNVALRVQPSGAVKTFFYSGSSTWPAATTAVTINDGTWHHVVGQYDGTNLEIYVDGVRQAQQPAGSAIVYGLGSSFYIGQHANGGTNHNFNGSIDQVRVFGRALSSAEIAALVAEGATSEVTFRVMTWNLRKCRGTDTPSGGGQDCNRVADTIYQKMNPMPDIMLLSAVHTSTQADMIRDRLNLHSGAGTWTVYYHREGGEGQAILTRHAMPNNPGDRDFLPVTTSECGGTENQTIVKATVIIGGKSLNVFAIDQQHGGENSAVRACQAAKFREWANAYAEPRIVGGDFNEVPGQPGITTWLNPTPPAIGYADGWAQAASHSGYGRENAQIGNDSTDSVFGRTLKNRIDYIIYRGATPGPATVWDMRIPNTTCQNVDAGSFLDPGSPCTSGCICKYVDDKGVRPTDHIPLTVTFSVQ